MKQKAEDFPKILEESFDRWNYIYQYGILDPLWEDGCNLNLVRNHIFYYRKKIEETLTQENYPQIYFRDVPPEVNPKYMARPDKIRKNAQASLSKYKTDKNYLYLLDHYNDFTPKTRDKLAVDNTIGYVSGLEYSIKNDKLVDMRGHEKSESCLKSFEECVRKIQTIPTETVQLSLFSFLIDKEEKEKFDELNEYDRMEM